MYYEISNVVFNHKPTNWDIRHKNPFHASKKSKMGNDYYRIEDTPQNLFKMFQKGHCIKPHAPTSPRLAVAHAIILDFDNLTKEQCDLVKSIVNEAKDGMCGDYSAGTKVRLHENNGIPNYEPPKWGYKVFYPIERVVMKEEIYDAFLEAVAFFNPNFTKDEVRSVFKSWVKCNNNKKRDDMLKVSDPIFNGWILPDVAMLNNFRNQITYGVDVEQREKIKTIDDFTISRYTTSMAKFPSTSKKDWPKGMWEANEVEEAKVGSQDESIKKRIGNALGMLRASLSKQEPTHLPMSRPHFAQMLGVTKFDDLVLPFEDVRHLMAACWSKSRNLTIDMYKMKLDATLIGKTTARLACEVRVQSKGNVAKPKSQGKAIGWMVEDCVSLFKSIHGMNVFAMLDERQTNVVLEAMSRSMVMSIASYNEWRTREKLKRTLSDPKVIEAREKWKRTKDKEDGEAYFKLREEDFKRRMSNPPSLPYAYRRRGLKKEMIEHALNSLSMLPTVEDWIEWVKMNLTKHDGVVDDEAIGGWYREYRERWNETHEVDKIKHKHHKSKWYDMFKGKSHEEIEAIINGLNIKKQMKYKLRKQYLNHGCYENT